MAKDVVVEAVVNVFAFFLDKGFEALLLALGYAKCRRIGQEKKLDAETCAEQYAWGHLFQQ